MNKKNQIPQGLFITIEGPEGAGKTTICKMLQEYLNTHDIANVFTREPGGYQVNICQNIRQLLLENNNLDPHTEALLFAANRCEHVQQLVKPSLSEGKIVVCDRFVDSSLAYQGAGRELGIKEVEAINDFALQGLEPDVTIFIDLPPEIGLARINQFRAHEKNHLDEAPLAFHQQVYQGYQHIIKHHKKRFHVVNGQQSLEEILHTIITIINKKLKEGNYSYHEI